MISTKLIFKNFLVRKGVGQSHHSNILAFDSALRNASMNQYNLVPVSSMLSSGSREIFYSKKLFEIGEVIFCVLSQTYGEQGQQMYAGLGYALGFDKRTKKRYGFVLERHNRAGHRALRRDIEVGLKQMARIRNFRITEKKIYLSGLKKIKKRFACALVILIYR